MGYFDSKTFAPGATGNQVWDFNPPGSGITLSQCLAADEYLYSGQMFVLRERLTFNVEIIDPTLIDVDLRWYSPLRYLGSYEVAGLNGFDGTSDSFALIHFLRTSIVKDHYCALINNQAGAPQLEQFGAIYQCNLQLVPKLITPKNGGDPVEGYVTTNREPLFTTALYRYPSQVENITINTECNYIGLHVYQGAELTTMTYEIALKSATRNQNYVGNIGTCVEGGCNEEFAAWVLLNNGGQPIDAGANIFSSLGLCEVGTNACSQGSYVCTSGESRAYWFVNNAG